MTRRLGKHDMQLINQALALLEAAIEDDDPAATARADNPEDRTYNRDLRTHERRLARVRTVRDKVRERLDNRSNS